MDSFERILRNLKKYGVFPQNYKSLGSSPRIIPLGYGSSINNVNKVVRNLIFKKMSGIYNEADMEILDLDLVSCYTCICLGLYPNKLYYIKEAVTSVGLWKFIEKEFIDLDRKSLFHKPYVKVCFYSALFGGGAKAMVDGVIKAEAKAAGMTESEFKTTKEFEEIHIKAKEIAREMEKLKVIKEFRELSKYVFEINQGGKLEGPTGHNYEITDQDTFRSNFASYLQSFEFAILAQSTINTIGKFPDSELLFHFHDGNVIAVRKSDKDKFLAEFCDQVKQVGESLGLKFTQKLELQQSF